MADVIREEDVGSCRGSWWILTRCWYRIYACHAMQLYHVDEIHLQRMECGASGMPAEVHTVALEHTRRHRSLTRCSCLLAIRT